MQISLSIFGQQPTQRSTMSEWITKFCDECNDGHIDTIWFPERHGKKDDVDHAHPLLNMAFMAGSLKTKTAPTPGAGSLIPGLHGLQETLDQIHQIDALSPSGVRVALGLGWDSSQFSRYSSEFDSRQDALRLLVESLRRDGYANNSKNVLQTISGNTNQWENAAKNGLGVYTAAFGKSMRMIANNALDYRRELINSPFRSDSGWVACMTHAFVDDNDEVAGDKYERIFRPYLENHGKRAGIGQKAQSTIISRSLNRMRNQMGLIGSPDTIMRRLQRFRKAGVDELVLLFQYSDELDAELEQIAKLREVLQNA